MYRCNRCDYVSTLFPEFPQSELPQPRNLEEIPKNYQTVDTTFGRGLFALLKILVPLGFIFILIMYLLSGSI